MKAFKEYLAESKKTYNFRIKIAQCDVDSEVLDRIEQALGAFQLADISKPKRLPISKCREFASLGPVERHVVDVQVNYPANSPQIQQVISQVANIPLQHIYVTNPLADDQEAAAEAASEQTPSGKALLVDPELTDEAGAQDTVGLKRLGNFLKELTKTGAEQYKGVNDNILAAKAPTEKAAKFNIDSPEGKDSPVGSKQNKIPSPVKGRK